MYPAWQMREKLPDAAHSAAWAGRASGVASRFYDRAQRRHAEALLTDDYTARHQRVATIEGESGTGKSLAARTLHDLGPATTGLFVPCVAAQFFQHGPSLASLPPLAADAREGTLLLSHVEELSLDQEARLIAFLQWIDHQQSRRTPEAAPRQVFFSSRAPLRKLAASPQFRADLCHRPTAIHFIMPPLRERRDDLALLADSFARQFSATQRQACPRHRSANTGASKRSQLAGQCARIAERDPHRGA